MLRTTMPRHSSAPSDAEDIERAGQHDGARAGVGHPALEVPERRVDTSPQVHERIVEEAVYEVGVAVGAGRPSRRPDQR
jgi:hypothetical protein